MDIEKHQDAYLESLEMRNYSKRGVKQIGRMLELFFEWCQVHKEKEQEIPGLAIIEAYQTWLCNAYKTLRGTPLSVNVQITKIEVIARFFKWCHQENLIPYNPATQLELPGKTKVLREFLTIHEIRKLFRLPDIKTALGLRDRTIMEVFYSTGIRESELACLNMYDVDSAKGTLWIRLGKNRKDRVVPIGERALLWMDRYLKEARVELTVEEDEGIVFLTCRGYPFRYQGRLSSIIRVYLNKAGIIKRGACHLLRHSMATHMLEAGADIRHIQAILGHLSLESTQIYTQLCTAQLKAVHRKCHPAEKEFQDENR